MTNYLIKFSLVCVLDMHFTNNHLRFITRVIQYKNRLIE